ncbi:MAG: caspase family protein [Pseudomonadota bacterium]
MQIDGRNWLAPVDAAPRDLADLRTQFIAADDLIQAGASQRVGLNMVLLNMVLLNMILLDACRDNPLASRAAGRSVTVDAPALRSVSAGLSSVAAPPGTLVVFVTAPGAVAFDGDGGYSPYAEALARALREPGERIEDIVIRVRGLVAGATGGR